MHRARRRQCASKRLIIVAWNFKEPTMMAWHMAGHRVWGLDIRMVSRPVVTRAGLRVRLKV